MAIEVNIEVVISANVSFPGLSSCDDCRPWIPPGPDDLSFIYSEPPQDSLADHITTYAVLRQARLFLEYLLLL